MIATDLKTAGKYERRLIRQSLVSNYDLWYQIRTETLKPPGIRIDKDELSWVWKCLYGQKEADGWPKDAGDGEATTIDCIIYAINDDESRR